MYHMKDCKGLSNGLAHAWPEAVAAMAVAAMLAFIVVGALS